MRFVAYYRVSTAKQGQSGLGLEAQRQTVLRSVGDGELLEEFTEVESGKLNSRPQLQVALKHARLTKSTLIVAKLDRLSRNAAFLNELFDADVPIRCADMPFADRFTVGILAQVAQWERERISDRTKSALVVAKARGRILGGKRVNQRCVGAAERIKALETRRFASEQRKLDVMPYVEAARAAGHTSLRGIARYLNARRIAAPRGGNWQAAQVARLKTEAS
ncbi:recombinase family protein [Sphingomonas humi]|uniref:Recombinase family protein n=1 Tax=Sphingomonas humi TaxID=335630 RepID=A0ABP7RY94_9SPHN